MCVVFEIGCIAKHTYLDLFAICDNRDSIAYSTLARYEVAEALHLYTITIISFDSELEWLLWSWHNRENCKIVACNALRLKVEHWS